jgi:hypothetical protein
VNKAKDGTRPALQPSAANLKSSGFCLLVQETVTAYHQKQDVENASKRHSKRQKRIVPYWSEDYGANPDGKQRQAG